MNLTNAFNTLTATEATGAAGGMGSMWIMIVIYVAIFGALYFFLIRPNSKKKKEEAELRNNIDIGDEITTIGGIMGRVVAIKADEDALIIETGPDRNKMKMKRWCVSTIDTQKEKPAAAKPEKKGFFAKLKKDKEEQ